MKAFKKLKEKSEDYLLDHPTQKKIYNWGFILVVEAVSSLLYAFGIKSFVNPSTECVEIWAQQSGSASQWANDIISPTHLIGGGATGLSQVIIKTLNIFFDVSSVGGANFDLETLLLSILYFAINIPLFIFAFVKISKQFTIFTAVNVGLCSLFIKIIPDSTIANTFNLYQDMLARALFGGIVTGVATAMAMAVGSCTGGTDIVTTYFSEKKSTGVGKYMILINMTIVLLYVVTSVIAHTTHPEWNSQDNNKVISSALYTLVYSFVSAKVLDFINRKNKKVELQVFTSVENVSQILIHAFPHSCTIIDGKGAYTGQKKYVLYMVISKPEAKKAIKIVKAADPQSFITVQDLSQVYGRFYIKPIE